MRNKYIRIVMNDRNEFKALAELAFNNVEYSLFEVKIDTGCGYSSFPIKRLGVSSKDALMLKYRDCNDPSVKKRISFGVNDNELKRREDMWLFKAGLYMDLSSITFSHRLDSLVIDDYSLGECDVRISYDRTNSILIGMDILRNLDVHIGTSKTGETILLACKREYQNDEYRDELNSLFNVKRLFL